jgi:hypothetical protein
MLWQLRRAGTAACTLGEPASLRAADFPRLKYGARSANPGSQSGRRAAAQADI